ncbi:MAG: hypothetical protein IJW30_06005 [Clostridia bacterium]|nr:hypothetical protein [Clostridia bacterium]MBQ9774201.1 hypothetical protein [Clostridia bacterium]
MNDTPSDIPSEAPITEDATTPFDEPVDAAAACVEELPTDPPADPDPDLSDDVPAPPTNELEALRGELNALRAEITAERSAREQIESQYEEFHTLYPEVSVASFSDAVWREVERGTPLAAAYALEERRRALTAQKAAESNAENKVRSAGAMKGTENDFFTSDEVRRMSRREVRANLQKIMLSMKKWH